MEFPKTVEEYWQLSREDRVELFKKHGFGWRTITEGIQYNNQQPGAKSGEEPGEKSGGEVVQMKLDFTE